MDDFEVHPHPAEIPPINPNTCLEIAFAFGRAVVMVLAVLCLWAALASPARAQDCTNYPDECGPAKIDPHANHGHPPGHIPLHEIFYSNWMRMDVNPQSSCCNMEDCFPTPMKQDANGAWWALRKHAALALENKVKAGENPPLPPLSDYTAWIFVPEFVLEHNAQRRDLERKKIVRDPRDSPDGFSHACISGENVFCAVIGTSL